MSGYFPEFPVPVPTTTFDNLSETFEEVGIDCGTGAGDDGDNAVAKERSGLGEKGEEVGGAVAGVTKSWDLNLEGSSKETGVVTEEDKELAVGNQVPAQTARLFLRESFLRILWNLRGHPASFSFLDRPDASGELVAFNREFDECVIVNCSGPEEQPRLEKIDLLLTSDITIDYQPQNIFSSELPK